MHLLIAFMAVTAGLSEPGYQQAGDANGVKVYVAKDSPQTKLAAVGEIDAPPAAVQAVLLDYAHASNLSKHISESTIVSKQPGELVVYQHLKLPVIKDRDYTVVVTWTAGHKGLQFAVASDRGPPVNKKAVRMSTMNGRWELTPLRGGTATRAVYHVVLDFGGSVSKSMVRDGAAKDLPNMYENIRRVTKSQRADLAQLTP